MKKKMADRNSRKEETWVGQVFVQKKKEEIKGMNAKEIMKEIKEIIEIQII